MPAQHQHLLVLCLSGGGGGNAGAVPGSGIYLLRSVLVKGSGLLLAGATPSKREEPLWQFCMLCQHEGLNTVDAGSSYLSISNRHSMSA